MKTFLAMRLPRFVPQGTTSVDPNGCASARGLLVIVLGEAIYRTEFSRLRRRGQ
jgi:hypothetical protein